MKMDAKEISQFSNEWYNFSRNVVPVLGTSRFAGFAGHSASLVISTAKLDSGRNVRQRALNGLYDRIIAAAWAPAHFLARSEIGGRQWTGGSGRMHRSASYANAR